MRAQPCHIKAFRFTKTPTVVFDNNETHAICDLHADSPALQGLPPREVWILATFAVMLNYKRIMKQFLKRLISKVPWHTEKD